MKSFKFFVESWDNKSWSRLPPGINSPLTFYNDTGPSGKFDKKMVETKDPYQRYQDHQTNMFMLQHLSKVAGEHNQTNTKIHYENQMEKARTKRDWWGTQKFTFKPFVHGSEEHKRANAMARHTAMKNLKEIGHDVTVPDAPKTKETEVVKNMPRTADGRIQFGVTKK